MCRAHVRRMSSAPSSWPAFAHAQPRPEPASATVPSFKRKHDGGGEQQQRDGREGPGLSGDGGRDADAPAPSGGGSEGGSGGSGMDAETSEFSAGTQGGGHSTAMTKVRKPYTITKQRERWTEEEHARFLEALQLHGRAWRKIEEHIGTKSAVQIRSHAQKFFSKLQREAERSAGSGADAVPGSSTGTVIIPPARPKRKPVHPYPRKASSNTSLKRSGSGQSAMMQSDADGVDISGGGRPIVPGPDGDRRGDGAGEDANTAEPHAGAGDLFSMHAMAAAHAGAMNAHAVALKQQQHHVPPHHGGALPAAVPGAFCGPYAGANGDAGGDGTEAMMAMMANPMMMGMMAMMCGAGTGIVAPAAPPPPQSAPDAAEAARATHQFFAALALLGAGDGASAVPAMPGAGGMPGMLLAVPPTVVTAAPASMVMPDGGLRFTVEAGVAEVQRPTAAHVSLTGAPPPLAMPPAAMPPAVVVNGAAAEGDLRRAIEVPTPTGGGVTPTQRRSMESPPGVVPAMVPAVNAGANATGGGSSGSAFSHWGSTSAFTRSAPPATTVNVQQPPYGFLPGSDVQVKALSV